MRLSLALLVCCSCAAPQASRVPYAEAFGVVKVRRALPADVELHSALKAFGEGAKVAREAGARGAPMPNAHADAWARLLGAVDGYLERPVEACSATDLARARLVVESEFELDGQLWGDVPATTADAVQGCLGQLSTRLSAVTALTARHPVSPDHFRWPLTPVVVTSPWGHRVHPISGRYTPHLGVDLAAETAQPVVAAYAGTVSFAGWRGAHGKSIELQHDPRWATRYSHLQVWLVEAGATVKKGQLIGLAGNTGQSTGVHLHFELLRAGEAVDPEELLPPPPGSSPMALAR